MAALSDEHLKLLKGRNFGVVATVDAEGRPQTSVVWVDTDGENVVFNTTNARAKGRNLRTNPRVSITVLDHDDPYRYFEVEGPAALDERRGGGAHPLALPAVRGQAVPHAGRPRDRAGLTATRLRLRSRRLSALVRDGGRLAPARRLTRGGYAPAMLSWLRSRPGATLLVAVAASLWGLDAWIRAPLAQSTAVATIVFGEHVLLVLLTLPFLAGALVAVVRLGWRHVVAAVVIGAGSSALATILFTQAFVDGHDFVTPVVLQKVQPIVAVVCAGLILGERPRRSFAFFFVPAHRRHLAHGRPAPVPSVRPRP